MQKILVSVVMGSDSDLPIMKNTAKLLEEFHVPYDMAILSAHRTPKALNSYIDHVVKTGVKVIIAGAGGAAHLPGVIAAHVSLPVIGVPIKTSTINGLDSLYSIVQMPSGIPVATVGINAAKNAGLLAVQILGLTDKKLEKRIIDSKKMMADAVLEKNKKLRKVGFENYGKDN